LGKLNFLRSLAPLQTYLATLGNEVSERSEIIAALDTHPLTNY